MEKESEISTNRTCLVLNWYYLNINLLKNSW